ncbi:MAG: ATP-binding protein [Eubacterium sp.]|nr:ATP-binding protein [Eubacterium sp.]
MDIKDLIHLDNNGDNELEYKVSEDGRSIIIDAVDEAMEVVQKFIKEKLDGYGCETKILGQIRLAVEEIFVNIISYAYHPEIGKAEIRCEVDDDPLSVTIEFMDSGKQFDPLARGEVDTSGVMFLEKPGGFGIHLVKKTMDDVEYEYKDGKNILTIKKNLK